MENLRDRPHVAHGTLKECKHMKTIPSHSGQSQPSTKSWKRLLLSIICLIAVGLIACSQFTVRPSSIMEYEVEKAASIGAGVLLSLTALICVLPTVVRSSLRLRLVALILMIVAAVCALKFLEILFNTYGFNN